MTKKLIIITFALAIPIGAFLIIYGGYDDSPGAQLLGLLAVLIGIAGLIRTLTKTPHEK